MDVPRPSVLPNSLVDLLLAEATSAPELWNQKSYLARAFSLDPDQGILDRASCRLPNSSTKRAPAGVAIAVETDDTGDIHPAVYVRQTNKPAVETLLSSQAMHDFRTAENRAQLSEILRGATAGAVR